MKSVIENALAGLVAAFILLLLGVIYGVRVQDAKLVMDILTVMGYMLMIIVPMAIISINPSKV
ncbi:hypothetical protein [Acinetobacter baumannii]|uniref:Dicarboxylate/amino acid:cation symporter n=1 Tax=Acinetobacter baumannii TaxID=470 RepID=A0ABD5DC67_ACIBA|nr:hypothetical protein [Acinetobacter baumannii]EHU3119781.1 hypothetical protein [Acinetobacter baumannii]EJB8489824.1 hypothetical protein [Acinetobacter baumannii]EKY1321290.1 hypothetical protein [Acinetobacter baumannii]EKY1523255.1 hypothetical protein [Acinetobacter baumannii]ENU52624.1 hypothetical protein F982_03772 [Acinetobacter baumannii NIPH 1362]